jgi:PadR family transcriptional regulator PadR
MRGSNSALAEGSLRLSHLFSIQADLWALSLTTDSVGLCCYQSVNERSIILGDTDHMVSAAVAQLKDSDSALSYASGLTVVKEIESRTGRQFSIGTICATLDRLEKRGFLTSEVSDRDGRRPKRFYYLTGEGQKALLEARHAVDSIWKGLKLSPIT